MSEKVYNESLENKLKMNLTLIQNQTIKNQVTSIWKYYNDKHLQEVRLFCQSIALCSILCLLKKCFIALK